MPPEIVALSDDKILKVAQVANQSEIEAAQLASARAETPAVRDYAKMLVAHHGAAQRRTMRVASQLGLGPSMSPDAEELRTESSKQMEGLRDKQGKEFDRAYLDAQVEAHENVLRLIDSRLEPEAKQPSVKSLVRDLRPTVAKHLDEARSLQDKLDKEPVTP